MYREEVRGVIRSDISETIVFIGNDNDTICVDNSIVGISEDYRLVYDSELIIKELMSDFKWSEPEAEDFYESGLARIVGSLGEKAPIIMTNEKFYEIYDWANRIKKQKDAVEQSKEFNAILDLVLE